MKPQPTGEPRPLIEWSRGIAAACHDYSPDPAKLAAHAERLRGRVFPFTTEGGSLGSRPCPYGAPGDELWVREAWAIRLDEDHLSPADIDPSRRWASYWADGPEKCCNTGCGGASGRVRSPIYMPRWASRITLRVTDVRVERVQDISELDCEAELGVPPYSLHDEAYSRFRERWNAINAKRGFGWDANPWVFAVSFERGEASA